MMMRNLFRKYAYAVIIYAATVELERRMTGWAHRSGMGQ